MTSCAFKDRPFNGGRLCQVTSSLRRILNVSGAVCSHLSHKSQTTVELLLTVSNLNSRE